MAETRGSWTVDEGVALQWAAKNLDATFRSYWAAGNDGFTPLNDTEARPNTPHPYCVYSAGTGRVVARSSGLVRDSKKREEAIPVSFTIHAKPVGALSAKSVAKELAKRIKSAFDPQNRLDFTPDCHITTLIQTPDFGVREGDNEWMWVVSYDFHIDITQNSMAVT